MKVRDSSKASNREGCNRHGSCGQEHGCRNGIQYEPPYGVLSIDGVQEYVRDVLNKIAAQVLVTMNRCFLLTPVFVIMKVQFAKGYWPLTVFMNKHAHNARFRAGCHEKSAGDPPSPSHRENPGATNILVGISFSKPGKDMNSA